MGQKQKLVWFIYIRLMLVTLFLASTVILDINDPNLFGDDLLVSLTRLVVVTYLFSILSLFALKLINGYDLSITYVQIIWDLCLVTVLLLITGGITSPYSFLYILCIINASILLYRREAIYTASLCSILFGAILDLQYYGKLDVLGLSPLPALQFGSHYIFYTIFVNIVAFYLTAFLTGYLAERARKSESALHRKVIDYQELERQHSTIVRNLNSGLMTITNEGMVRVFNHYGEQLAGLSQDEAYDRHVSAIFPQISSLLSESDKGEIEYSSPDGNILILGIHTAPLTDVHDTIVGTIINFHDLTRIKRMEEALKRADRLAAIGELAARIAHEIRNPLASISGSVQLIAQGDGVTLQDRRLLDIVLRETERLNELIRDFLEYARPRHPEKESVPFHRFLSDLLSLMESDPRFKGISVHNDFNSNLDVVVDRDQMRQVFWNLLVNASESMPAGGTILIRAELINSDETGMSWGDVVRIEVTDSGAGMTRDERNKVFEPFFTTKPGGTGLGLATVYRIVDSHGGTIFVDSAVNKGTTFTILLPVT